MQLTIRLKDGGLGERGNEFISICLYIYIYIYGAVMYMYVYICVYVNAITIGGVSVHACV